MNANTQQNANSTTASGIGKFFKVGGIVIIQLNVRTNGEFLRALAVYGRDTNIYPNTTLVDSTTLRYHESGTVSRDFSVPQGVTSSQMEAAKEALTAGFVLSGLAIERDGHRAGRPAFIQTFRCPHYAGTEIMEGNLEEYMRFGSIPYGNYAGTVTSGNVVNIPPYLQVGLFDIFCEFQPNGNIVFRTDSQPGGEYQDLTWNNLAGRANDGSKWSATGRIADATPVYFNSSRVSGTLIYFTNQV